MADTDKSQIAVLVLRTMVRAGFLVIAAMLLFVLLTSWSPSLRLLATIANFSKYAAKRSKHCSLLDVWRSLRAADADSAGTREIDKVAKVLGTDGPLVQIETPLGDFWLPKRDLHRTSFVFWEQTKSIYEFGEYRVKPGDTVLDCGANIGIFARRALKAGAEKVICIEPSPESLECLRRNFAAEIVAGRVIVCPKGVWNKEDWLELSVSDLYSIADTVALGGAGLRRSGQKVRLTTIDKLATELNLARVDFIKMDIEGAERQALQGAVQTVMRFRPRMAIALEHRPEDLEEMPRLIARQWPTARVSCGPCSWVRSAQAVRVQPEIVFAAF